MQVKTGLDGISLTFSENVLNVTKIAELIGADPAHFIRMDDCDINWYGLCYKYGYEQNGKQTVLASYYCLPISQYGRRELLQIHGLCFSDSALNMLRGNFDLGRLVRFAVEHHASVSKIDLYLDDHTAAVSQQRLNEMSQPHTFEQYIQSPFLRSKNGDKPLPRPVGTPDALSWYYGTKQANSCQIISYNKGRCPRQQIHRAANPLKFSWHRYEIRLTAQTAKRVGKKFLNDLVGGANLNTCITDLFRQYLRFVEPRPNNKRPSSWPLQQWYSNLLAIADDQPPVTITDPL